VPSGSGYSHRCCKNAESCRSSAMR
jgi:hypothetical protein